MTSSGFRVHTPLGDMWASVAQGYLLGLTFGTEGAMTPPVGADGSVLRRTLERQLEEWWEGRRALFDLPLAARGTPFQRAVWTSVQAVPRGSVTSYGALAAQLGHGGAYRAVGAALAANPWMLVVPCHRVVAADGGLTGYAGGVERKRALLLLESQGTC